MGIRETAMNNFLLGGLLTSSYTRTQNAQVTAITFVSRLSRTVLLLLCEATRACSTAFSTARSTACSTACSTAECMSLYGGMQQRHSICCAVILLTFDIREDLCLWQLFSDGVLNVYCFLGMLAGEVCSAYIPFLSTPSNAASR